MRTINVEIVGQFIKKDNKNAGVKGESNATTLHITLDETWRGFGKRIIWRDATGQNPTSIILFAYNSLSNDPLTYDTYIPTEPLMIPGWCSFTLEGYREVDGVHQVEISITDELYVEDIGAVRQLAASTASEEQQIMEALGKTEENVKKSATEAKSWAVGGTGSRSGEDADNAKYYSGLSQTSRDQAQASAQAAASSASQSAASAQDAASSANQARQQIDAAKSWANGFQTETEEWGQDFKQDMETWGDGFQSEANASYQNHFNTIKQWCSNFKATIESWGASFRSSMDSWADRIKRDIQSLGDKLINQARDWSIKAQNSATDAAAAADESEQWALDSKKNRLDVERLSVSAKELNPEDYPTAEVTRRTCGRLHIEFGIPPGRDGMNGVTVETEGMYGFHVNEEGHLILVYTGDEAPNFRINEAGHLIWEVE